MVQELSDVGRRRTDKSCKKRLSKDSSKEVGFELEEEIENLPDGSRVVRCGRKETGSYLLAPQLQGARKSS